MQHLGEYARKAPQIRQVREQVRAAERRVRHVIDGDGEIGIGLDERHNVGQARCEVSSVIANAMAPREYVATSGAIQNCGLVIDGTCSSLATGRSSTRRARFTAALVLAAAISVLGAQHLAPR
jgi:hypothetical protein